MGPSKKITARVDSFIKDMHTDTQEMLLKVESLNTFYGKAQILFDMALEVKRGEVNVLLGRNGAGKSTTFKSIMGMVSPRSGTITYKGQPILGKPPFKICSLGLGYVPEDRRIFSRLTIMENLEVGRQPPREGLEPWTPERLFELFPNLGQRPDQPGGTLSGGEQQMLTIARTLMGNPEMLILDEPSEGLAPVIVEKLTGTIQQLKSEGVSMLLAEQNLNFARSICDRAYVVYRGSTCHTGAIDELSQDVYEQYCAF